MKEPKIDAKTREYLQKWTPAEVPVAEVTGGSIVPGTWRGLATLGWMEHQGQTPVCGVHFLILRNHEFKPFATLSLAMPVTKTTELHVNSFLHLIGWDGRVWPYDADGGWPENSEEDADQVQELLGKLRPRIAATLTFPPKDGLGGTLIPIHVRKKKGTFHLAPFEPLPEDADSPVIHLERFRELCRDPSPFVMN